MKLTTTSVGDYINNLPEDRKSAMVELRKTIIENLPEGFCEMMSYGMIGYVVPHSTYPAGYHCDPKLPLGFINIASQKNFIVMHHMGIYADASLLKWFTDEYPKHSKTKLDMGKGCIRFKKIDQIPYKLIGELVTKLTPQQWITKYEAIFRNKL
jgi:uncharacterized protein YdhG (YjbR/CyaY superfamily)